MKIGSLAPFNTIGKEELENVKQALQSPLSGFLGGEGRAGYFVTELEQKFRLSFDIQYAISVNSATSGLHAALIACGVGPGDEVIVSPYTMSATAAVVVACGAYPIFADILPRSFCISPEEVALRLTGKTKAVIATNLFGHPAALYALKDICHRRNVKLIEDNAQAWFAQLRGKFTGTIGDIGVFSFNIHKQLQAGEGGVCVTNDEVLANRMRAFRNHGEMAGGDIGLNLRMTEVTAAIAVAQLDKAMAIIGSRCSLYAKLSEVFEMKPYLGHGCTHGHYFWATLLPREVNRDLFVKNMNAEGVPLRAGYLTPIYHLPAFKHNHRAPLLPIVEEVERRLIGFEVCAYDPTMEQLELFHAAYRKISSSMFGRQP